jgi:hypothetical protein
LEDLTGVEVCVNMTYLDVSHCGRLQSLLPLESCTALNFLDIRGCPQVLCPTTLPDAIKHLEPAIVAAKFDDDEDDDLFF